MLRNFFAREELARQAAGQTMVEYALILFLVSVVAIAALALLGTQVNVIFTSIKTSL